MDIWIKIIFFIQKNHSMRQKCDKNLDKMSNLSISYSLEISIFKLKDQGVYLIWPKVQGVYFILFFSKFYCVGNIIGKRKKKKRRE